MPPPEIILIVAMARNRVIGLDNRIPWHIPEDLQHFKATTLHHAVVMGRRTWESIGRPLTQRTNIVVSRAKNYHAPHCHTAPSLADAIRYATEKHTKIFIIGGGEVYKDALPLAQTILISLLHREVEGTVLFPPIPASFKLKHQTPYHWSEPVTLQQFSRIK